MQYHLFKTFFLSFGIVAIVLFVTSPVVFAAPGVPNIVSYQGRLTDSSGRLLGGSGTSYYFRFSLWSTSTIGGGSKLWPTGQPGIVTTSVVDGVFNVNIGDTVNGYPDALTYNFQDSDAAYLQIEVSNDGVSFETLGPRQRIVSSGYAINAQTVGGLTPGTAANNILRLGADGAIVLSSTGISTLGDITAGVVSGGTWQGTAIGDAYITKTGNWTGTFDGNEGSYYLNATNLTNFSTPFATAFGSMNTDNLAEGLTKLYYSDTRARAALSAGSGIGYSSITGIISNSGVLSFNTRLGVVTLISGDVTGALGFTPMNPSGTIAQYFRGNGTVATFPTAVSSFTNDSGYATGGGTASGTNTGDQTITLTGDVTGSGTGSFATTIGALKITNDMLAGSIAASKLTGTDIATVGTITSGTWNGSVINATYIDTAIARLASPVFTGNVTLPGTGIWNSSGNVGIGTPSPNQQLEITKNFRLPATTYNAGSPYGVIYKDANRFIHDFNYGNNGTVTTTGQNTFVGISAGNLTMGSTATQTNHASFNTGIGYQSLTANTLGLGNTAIGATALVANTTGNQNTAIGYDAMASNTTGYQNTAMGGSALNRNTTGINNVVVGPSALYYNTTGSHNTAVGFIAGYLTAAGGSNSTSNDSVYLGYFTKAGASGNTNEIVIGATAAGNGSNTATIGNTSILRTYLTGVNLKAGTTAAGTAPLKFTSGALLTTAEAGAVEFFGDAFYGTITTGAARKQFAFTSDITGVNSGTNTGDITLGAIGATPNASGASLSGQVLTLQPADASFGGVITTGAQSITGAKTFITSLATPLLIGGTSTTQTLTYKTTTGVGTTGADHIFQTGNNGATEAMRILNSGDVGIGTPGPGHKLDVAGSINISTGSAYKYNGVNVILAKTALNDYFFGGAGNLTMTGADNVAVGYQAVASNTSGIRNTAVGTQALFSNTGSSFNTVMGYQALYNGTFGDNNTVMGHTAMYNNYNGDQNVAIGGDALYSNYDGNDNVAVGVLALNNNSTGDFNTALGMSAIRNLQSGHRNTVIGYNSGLGLSTGSNNTIIGASVTGLSAALSNNIIIADGQGNQRINVESTGNVGIGDTTADYKLDVKGTICQDTDSDEICDGSVTSDARLKINIENIPSALEKIRQLRGVYFDWDDTIGHTAFLGRGTRQVGVIAQEIESVFPSLVYYDKDGYRMVDYQKLTGPLIEAVKELDITVQTIPSYEDETFSSKITDFLRGIAERGEAIIDTVRAKKLCAEDVCIDRDQLQEMIEYINTHQNSSAPSDSTPPTEDEGVPESTQDTPVQEEETDTPAPPAEEPAPEELVPAPEPETTTEPVSEPESLPIE